MEMQTFRTLRGHLWLKILLSPAVIIASGIAAVIYASFLAVALLVVQTVGFIVSVCGSLKWLGDAIAGVYPSAQHR